MNRLIASASAAAVAAVAVLVFAPSAFATTPTQNIGNSSTGPLTLVSVGNDLSCQVAHLSDSAYEFYPPSANPGDCGTFLASGGTLYAPDFANHDGTATGNLGSYTPFTAVSQSSPSGSGTTASPRTVTTVDTAGSFRVTEVDSYVYGQERYRTDVTVTNTGSSTQSLILYRAGDCYLQGSDTGYGFQESGTTRIGCSKTANNSPPNYIEEWQPITGGNHYVETFYGTVWGDIGSQNPFPNTCDCTTDEDNGGGLSWSETLAAGASVTLSHYTVFSPTGSTSGVPAPPPALSLSVSPHITRTGRHTCFTFTVTHSGSAVSGSTVKFHGLTGTTSSNGKVTMCQTIHHRGTYGATASKTGYTSATADVTVRRKTTPKPKPKPKAVTKPAFTG